MQRNIMNCVGIFRTLISVIMAVYIQIYCEPCHLAKLSVQQNTVLACDVSPNT
jgi:hypothetical protein